MPPRCDCDVTFEHKLETLGDYVLDVDGKVIATGGFMLYDNEPFAGLYMEVREDWRERGAGTFLLQEVKKACYQAGSVPAARCEIQDVASRATLKIAGMRPCGYMLFGRFDDL